MSYKALAISPQGEVLERLSSVALRCGMSRSQLYRKIKAGEIGPLVKLGARSSAIPKEAVNQWIMSRIDEARNNQKGD